MKDIAVVDPASLIQNVKYGPLCHTAHGNCALSRFFLVVATSNNFVVTFFFLCA